MSPTDHASPSRGLLGSATRAWGIAAALVALAAVLIAAPTGGAAENVETQYVAELRATVAQLRASHKEIATLRSAGSGALWRRGKAEPNPNGAPSGPAETVSAGDGRLVRTFTEDPTASFDATWPSPPAILAPGSKYAFKLTVGGAIDTSSTVQGFRTHSAILLVNDDWPPTRPGVEVGQSCAKPSIFAPVECTGPSSASRTLTVGVPPSTSGTFSFGVGALNCGACYVRYAYTATGRDQLARDAGSRLLAAVRRARAMLRTYQRADTRHGTPEEHALVAEMLRLLRLSAASYGAIAKAPVRTTPRKVRLAERLVRAISKEAAAAAVERWPGLPRIVALLRDPRQANRVVERELKRWLAEELRRRRRAIAQRAIRDRLPFQLGVPIRTQLRRAAEDYAIKRLSRVLLKLDGRGLLLEFFGEKLRIAIRDIAQAARPTAKVERRTEITLAGYERRQERLDDLRAVTGSKLPAVRAALDEARGSFQAARFLRADLKRLVKRRCKNPSSPRCEGAKTTRDRLAAADYKLTRAMRQTRKTFLIGREFDPAELRVWIAGLGRMEADVKRANRKLR